MRLLRRLAGLVLLFLILAALGMGGAKIAAKKKKALAAVPGYATRPTPVHTAKSREGDIEERVDFLAVVEPSQVAAMAARLTATVEEIRVDEGDPVKAGDVLLVLDGAEIRDSIATIEAQIEGAEAGLASNEATVSSLSSTVDYWKREAERDRNLVNKGDIPASQAEGTSDKANEVNGRHLAAVQHSNALRHELKALAMQRARLDTQLGYCTIKSPFDGMVSKRLVDPGDLAAPGLRLLVVEDRSHLKASFDIPQSDLAMIREGLPVVFASDGEEREAKLDHLFPSLDASRTLRAEVKLDTNLADGLYPGAYLRLCVVTGIHRGVTLIPRTALVQSPDGESHVFVVSEGKLRSTPVRIVAGGGDDVAIEGIAAGEKVVTSSFLGWARLSGGMKVEAIR